MAVLERPVSAVGTAGIATRRDPHAPSSPTISRCMASSCEFLPMDLRRRRPRPEIIVNDGPILYGEPEARQKIATLV